MLDKLLVGRVRDIRHSYSDSFVGSLASFLMYVTSVSRIERLKKRRRLVNYLGLLSEPS